MNVLTVTRPDHFIYAGSNRWAGIAKDDNMTKFLNNKVRVHGFFHELFGRETSTVDLLAIIVSSFSFAGLTLSLKWKANVSIIKQFLPLTLPLVL